MKLISTEKDFGLIKEAIDRIIDSSKELPENVFRSELKNFLFVTFDEVLMTLFFNHIEKYLIEVGEDVFWLSTVDPDPKLYYAKHFEYYGAFEFSARDSDDDYVSALNDYPKESPADALMHNTNTLVVSSYTNKWAIFASREDDVAVCAFSESAQMELFRSVYGSDLLDGVEAAAEYAYGSSIDTSQIEVFCKSFSLC